MSERRRDPLPGGPVHGRRACASLLAGLVIQISVGNTMAATLPSTAERLVPHCTGRFDYALPATLQSSGGTQSLYRLDIAAEPWPAGIESGAAWKRRLGTILTAKGVSPTAAARTPSSTWPGWAGPRGSRSTPTGPTW